MPSLSRLLCYALMLTSLMAVSARGDIVAQTPDAKSKGTGSVSGKVTLGGKPAAGIHVAAFGNFSNTRQAAAEAVTDSEGHYRLFGLTAAAYQIAPLTPSFVPAEKNLPPNYPYYGAAKTILLSAGESVEDVDLKLVRGAVITGRVTDEEGRPVIEERINLQMADQPTGQPAAFLVANYQIYQTDDRGVYRLYGLPAGRYRVGAGSDPNNGGFAGGVRGYFPQTFYGDTNDATKATIVEVGEGTEASNIDIRLGHRSATFSIAGRVVDSETGEPIAGIRPTYGRVSKDNPGSGAYMSGMPTNSRGEFRFDGLEPGHYTVFASSRFDGGEFYSDPIAFDLVDRNVTDLELKAIRGLSVSGFVVTDSDTNSTLAQLGGLRVSASVRSPTNSPAGGSSGWSPVAPDGSFQIRGLGPGKAVLYVYSADNSSPRRFSLARIERDGVEQTQGFDLQAGQSISNVRVFLSYGTGVIRGTVKFENGSRPPEARIYVGLMRNGRSVDRGAQTDVRGHFLITDIPPGNYEVTLNMGFSTPSPQPPQRPRAPLKQFVTVADDSEVEVTFTVDLKPKEGGP